MRSVQRVLGVAAQPQGDFCVVAAAGDTPREHLLVVCDAIGSPMDRVQVSFEPRLLAISDSHVIAADADVVYSWHYMSSSSMLSAMDL